jgi:hypothetical protein
MRLFASIACVCLLSVGVFSAPKVPTGTLDLNPGSTLVYHAQFWFDYTISGSNSWNPYIEVLCYQAGVLIAGDQKPASFQAVNHFIIGWGEGDPLQSAQCLARLTQFVRSGWKDPGQLHVLDTVTFDITP